MEQELERFYTLFPIPYTLFAPSASALYFILRIAYGGGFWQPLAADIECFNWVGFWADKQDVPAGVSGHSVWASALVGEISCGSAWFLTNIRPNKG